MGKTRNANDIDSTVEWLVSSFSMEELVQIITGVNESVGDDEFITTMFSYFDTFIEPVNWDSFESDDNIS